MADVSSYDVLLNVSLMTRPVCSFTLSRYLFGGGAANLEILSTETISSSYHLHYWWRPFSSVPFWRIRPSDGFLRRKDI